ncbi:uncharacterized protein LOC131696184 [Topomyia yanbarensis]|uniref:uncharacterized protein LOC131677456 n=1 Tax=Topomyia yanbarensis TaxID=2498891 RepID=UPI00273CCDDD|nr:uncharacterized protein LOC131677456 [Topomyia yanbarensis]XP_058840709.1 uncharacterized protein LOC131696184 [Topomyia yanbarensis]
MTRKCVVGKCKSTEKTSGVRFFRFPAVKSQLPALVRKRREEWKRILALEDHYNPTNAYICSLHFVTGKAAKLTDVTHIDWVPSLKLNEPESSGVLENREMLNRSVVRCSELHQIPHDRFELFASTQYMAFLTVQNENVDKNGVGIEKNGFHDNGYEPFSDNGYEPFVNYLTNQHHIEPWIKLNSSPRKPEEIFSSEKSEEVVKLEKDETEHSNPLRTIPMKITSVDY